MLRHCVYLTWILVDLPGVKSCSEAVSRCSRRAHHWLILRAVGARAGNACVRFQVLGSAVDGVPRAEVLAVSRVAQVGQVDGSRARVVLVLAVARAKRVGRLLLVHAARVVVVAAHQPRQVVDRPRTVVLSRYRAARFRLAVHHVRVSAACLRCVNYIQMYVCG